MVLVIAVAMSTAAKKVAEDVNFTFLILTWLPSVVLLVVLILQKFNTIHWKTICVLIRGLFRNKTFVKTPFPFPSHVAIYHVSSVQTW